MGLFNLGKQETSRNILLKGRIFGALEMDPFATAPDKQTAF
jgi:hypothetical protein